MALLDYLRGLRESESHGGRFGATMPGQPVTTEAMLRESGVALGSPQRTAQRGYQETFSEVQRLYDKVLRGDRWASLRFQEAMTISDFPGYFGDVIDRQVLANYAETPYTWSAYCKRATLMDFRLTKLFRFDRGASVLDGPIIPNSYGASGAGPTGIEQVSEYPMRYRVATNYTDQLYKFGARMDFAWEVLINDDLDMLKDTPALFGRAARRTEEKRATELYVSSGGPNATFFSTANSNLVTNSASQFPFVTTNNPPLSVTSLAWALQIAAMQRDLDGEPISVDMWTLVVPPALDITARNILQATNIWMNDQGGTLATFGSGATANAQSAQRLLTDNWARGRVRPALNYYLPVVNTTSGNTAWYLFANPDSGRPALQQSFLRSQPAPQMFMKSPNAVVIGEGRMGPGSSMPGSALANPMDGDFDTDAIMYKIRHVLGGTLLDPIMAVASSGAGS